MSDGKQPPRAETDGAVRVWWDGDDLCVSCETDGKGQMVKMGEFNAWRIFGMMAVLLKVTLSKKVSKGIKL